MKTNKKTSVVVVVILIAAAAAAVVIGAILLSGAVYQDVYLETDECFCITDDSQAAILINGSLSEEKAVYENGRVWLPWDLVSLFPGNALYYESASETLYLTTQKESKTWKDGSGVLMIAGDGKVYIDADAVREYTDAEVGIYNDPARAVIRTVWNDVVTAETTQDTKMRQGIEERSPVVSDVPAGTLLYYAGTEEEGRSLVYADSGYFGYVETAKLEFSDPQDLPHETNELTTFDKISMNETVKMVWHYVDVQENNDILDYMLEDTGGINLICPTWITIRDKNGNIASLADADYVKNIRARNMKIWTMVSDYLGGDSSTGEILDDPVSRKKLVDNIFNAAKTYGLDGINIDFETITEEYAPAFLQFLRELSVKTHESGIILSVDNFVPGYTRYYNRTEQAKIVDYIIIMGYDENTEYSAEPGSVASLPFVREGVEQTLIEVPKEQVILGVPFYTRSWTQPFGSDYFETEALAMPNAEQFCIDKGIELVWDENLGQNVGSSEDDTARYSMWMEDAKSLSKKLELVKTYGLSGAAAWRLGLENPDVWAVWKKTLN